MENKRAAPRTSMKMRILIKHPHHGDLLLHTRDISDSGVFVVFDQAQGMLRVGDVISGQVQDLPIEAPVVDMQVVRLEISGMGLRFQRED